MLRIAVIGAGRIGQVHAAAVAAHPRARLVAVADPVAEAAERLAATHGVRAATTVGDVLGEDVDAVVVGSPTDHHVDQVVAAVAAGKAVLCEKPVASTLARVDECLAAVAGSEHRVMVGFNRRFDPGLAEVRSRVAAGEIGPLAQLSIVSRDPAPPPVAYLAGSGGIFRDMTIHDLDTAAWFLGEVVSVHAVGQASDPAFAAAGDWDGAVLTLVGASGAVATIVNSRRCATGYDQRVEAFGPDGSLTLENLTATPVRAATATTSGARGPYLAFFLERYAAAYRAEMDHFVTAIEAGRAPQPDLRAGRAALVLADAATESARTGLTVRVGADPT